MSKDRAKERSAGSKQDKQEATLTSWRVEREHQREVSRQRTRETKSSLTN